MGKPLSRPDCLRQNPTCLGKGEEEDGYIEDCYVPQRSIYDTMRINEQIDQGSKLNQPSKSTLDKVDANTISSNGTLGASNVFESRAPESKKLDERVIFDALKLSSDVSKSAPAPPRRRPNPERKENVNRRSWKSFMPPNFPEFAERIEASLSEVSEAGASNSSLQEKRESGTMLAENSGHLDHREPMSESLTLEHVSKSSGIPEVQETKQLSEDCFQDECQPLLKPEDTPATSMVITRDQKLSSATWPRARRNVIKGSLSDGHQETLEATQADCTVETVQLSPCLSEEMLDSGMNILITPSLREKTESELRFEEDERWIMMEAEEEWEEEMLSEGGKTVLLTDEKRNCCLADISEEREQLTATAVTTETTDSSAGVLGISNHPAHHPVHCDDSQLHDNCSASVPQETYQDLNCAFTDNICDTEDLTVQFEAEDFTPNLECCVSSVVPEQFSDTDSVQMFLELEKQCLSEEGDGASSVDLEGPVSGTCSEGLDPQTDSEKLVEVETEECQQTVPFEVSAADSAIVSDLEDFDVTYSSQVVSTIEPTTEPYSEKETTSVTQTDSEEVGVSRTFPHPSDWLFMPQEDQASLETYSKVEWTSEEYTRRVSSSHSFHCQPFVPATSAKELHSQQDFYWLKSEVSAEGANSSENNEHPLSERTEFSNWGVSELVSEDEVTDLDKESNRLEGQIHGTEHLDTHCFSQAPFPNGSISEQGSEAWVKSTESIEDLQSEETVSLGQLLHAEGITPGEEFPIAHVVQEDVPKMVGEVMLDVSTGEADIWEPGDLAWLFEHSWTDNLISCVAGVQFVRGNTHSPVCVEPVCAGAEECTSMVTTAEEELAAITAPFSVELLAPTVLDSTKTLPTALSAVEEPVADAGLPAAEEPVADAAPPAVEEPVLALPDTEEHATIAMASSVEELPTDTPGMEGFPGLTAARPEEFNTAVISSTKEHAASPQEMEELAMALPFSTEELATASSGLEEPVAAGQAPGASCASEHSTQMLPAAVLEMEDPPPLSRLLAKELSSTASGVKALASTMTDTEGSLITVLVAEGAPAVTDELVPDNEVFVTKLLTRVCQTGNPFICGRGERKS
uniref:Uncharacterized protein n=1 Tax=Chelonoidis abingdonii TaxID=106734 RepID=A0A8C0G289_CHEAB